MIAVEVLSPGEEIEAKLTLYFAHGAREVWVVDARRKTIAIYAKQANQVVRSVVEREFCSPTTGVPFTWPEIFE